MDDKKKLIDDSVINTQELAKKIFEIATILNSNPHEITGALAIALGISCGSFNLTPESLNAVIKEFYDKTKALYDQVYGDKSVTTDRVTTEIKKPTEAN